MYKFNRKLIFGSQPFHKNVNAGNYYKQYLFFANYLLFDFIDARE